MCEKFEEIKLNEKPDCVSFKAVFKRKLFAAFIPFMIAFALQAVVQSLMLAFTVKENPFLTAPIFMFAFFMFAGNVFAYAYESKFGVTRKQSYLSSYAVAAVYAILMTTLCLALAIIEHYIKYSFISLWFRITAADTTIVFLFGFFSCALAYPLAAVAYKYKHSGWLGILIACIVLTFAILFFGNVFTGLIKGLKQYEKLMFVRGCATATLAVSFAVCGALDYCLSRKGIVR